MTVTDTEAPPDAPAGGATAAAGASPGSDRASGFAAALGSADHKLVGRLFIATSCIFLVVAGIAGALVGVERADVSGIDVLDVDTVGQVLSLYGVSATFLFLLPALLGLAILVVPLQVGSSNVAFPRAAAAAYWTYLVSGGVVLASYIADGGPFGGESQAVELFIAAMIGLLAALTLAAVCVATTVLALRAPGMGLHRAPLFAWSTLVWGAVLTLALPALAGLLLLVYVDHRYGQTFLGGSDQVYLRLSWFWSQPNVYVFAVPALGIVGDVVPLVARTRLTLHRVAMGCIGAFAILSFGVWAMPGFVPRPAPEQPLEYFGEVPFYGFSFLVLLPLLAFAGLLADTLRRGGFRLLSPVLWGLGALLMLLAGAANGALVSIDPLDLAGTTAQTAQTHYVLGAALLGLLGGLALWAPKITGGSVPETPSSALAGLGLVGTILLSLPDLVSGFLEQPVLLGPVTDDASTIEALNIVSLAGGLLLLAVALAFLGLVAFSAASKREVGDDPWEGHTLEWATTSPPPVGNFTELPAVTSEAPLYDARHAAQGGTD